MLVRSEQIPELQTRSNQEPYSGMKNRAIAECTQRVMQPINGVSCNGNLNPNLYPQMSTHSFCVRAIMSSCALAAITDPANKSTYINKVVASMPFWENILIVQSGADDGTRNTSNEFYTDATAAYMNTLLAIDILNQDLSSIPANISYPGLSTFTNQRQYAEFLMEQEFNHFYGSSKPVYNFSLKDGSTITYNMPSRHPPAKEAALILWKIYSGTFNTADSVSQTLLHGGTLDGIPVGGFLPELSARVNESGVYTEGSSYAHAGWGLDRDERSHLVDVLEFTGKDVEFGLDFYSDPRYQTFYEWLYGYASTPFGIMTSFGDTYAFRQLIDDGHGGNSWATSSHIGQAGRFSNLAGGYAVWKSRGQPQQGRLLNYLLYNPNQSTTLPQSRIFSNGGGFFLSQPVGDQSLYGALWNVKEPIAGSPVFHVRKDVNAMYLAAYGAPLIMNGGFCGASSPSGPDSCSGTDENNVSYRFSGTYLGDRAVSNSVGMINYSVGTDILNPNPDSQVSKFGTGVQEGFTSNGLDYVSASSGTALNNGMHTRNFLLVHPSSGSHGYFLSFDEFSQLSTTPVHLVFHPNATNRQEVSPLTEFTMLAGRRAYADTSTGLSLYFATQPSNIQFYRGIIATAGSIGAYVPEYFFNTYPTNGNAKQIATVLFPYNASHPKPPMSRITGTSYTGATINHSATVIDTALESSSATTINYAGVSLQGKAAFYRKSNNQVTLYFVRHGREFNDGNANRIGFSSTQPVSLMLNEGNGNIVSQGTEVTFYYPGITGVRLNGQTVTNLSSGNGFVRVQIPAGTQTLSLIAPNLPSPTAGPSPTIPLTPTPNLSLDGDTDIDYADFSLLIRNFWSTTFLAADFNSSGRVDIFDFNRLIRSWIN